MITYHWTPKNNVPSILAEGLNPKYSQGRLAVVWVCEMFRVNELRSHIAMHHDCDEEDLALFVAAVDDDLLVKTRWAGVWQMRDVVVPALLGLVSYRRQVPGRRTKAKGAQASQEQDLVLLPFPGSQSKPGG